MGFFSKVNSALGIGKNNDALRIGAAIGTGGMSELATGGAKDLLLGKKAKDIKPDSIANQIRATQGQGLKELNNTLNKTSGENIARVASAQAEKGVLSSAQDARRNAQKLMAQRGLQGSSMGLASQRSIDQQSGNDIANIQAQLPGQIRNQQLADAQTRIQAGGINQNGMNFNTIQGQRSGGILGIAGALAPLAGTIGGAMIGGPAGAAVGSQVGSGIGGALAPQGQQGAYNPNKYSMGNYQF